MKGCCDIYIIKVDGEYRVRPAVWSTDADRRKGNNIILFRNFTSNTVVVNLPARLVGRKQGAALTLEPAREKGDVGEVTLTAKAKNLAGVYPYTVAVTTKGRDEEANGESKPIIIIDPPPQ
jgi:hypothetical protein